MAISTNMRNIALLLGVSGMVLALPITASAQYLQPKANHFLTMPVNHNAQMGPVAGPPMMMSAQGRYAVNPAMPARQTPPVYAPQYQPPKLAPKKWNPRPHYGAPRNGFHSRPAVFPKPHKARGKQRYAPNHSGNNNIGLYDRMRGQRPLHQQAYAAPGMPAFQQWIDYEPEYRLYPGDQLDIVVASAPELSRTLTVGPDGRIVMPMTKPVMAAGKSFTQVQNALSAQLASELRDPSVAVTPRAYSPEQIYVGGEVGAPGTYTLPGPVGALEGLLMAGGMRPTARTKQIAVMRRAPNGGMMMRTVNIHNGLMNIREYNDNIQLRRGDIIFVPRNSLAEIGVFMQNFRNALPVDFNVSYNLGDSFRANN